MGTKFLAALFSLLIVTSGVNAADKKFCINRSEPRTAKPHYSFDFNTKRATDRAGWIWIKSEWDGDMWPLDTIQSPDGKSKTSMPILYYKTCSYWQDLWGSCRFAGSSFSKAAGIAFITGNKKNALGFEMPKSYALYGDTVVELPSNFLKATRYRGDVSTLGYAALRGLKEELVLFNGDETIIIKIPEASYRKDDLPSWTISNDINTGRSFVHTNALKGTPMFLYEIYDAPDIRKIDLDPNLRGWISLLSEPITKQMFIIDRYGIYAEINNTFKRIAHLPISDHIYGPANLGYTENNEVYFEIVQSDKSNKNPYVLQPYETADNCDNTLNLNEDKMLKSK
jgi:hypothetical protein